MTRVPLDCGRTITTLSTSRERMFYYHKKKPGNPGRGNRASRRTLARDRTWKDRATLLTPGPPCRSNRARPLWQLPQRKRAPSRKFILQPSCIRPDQRSCGEARGRHLSGAFLTKPNLRQLAPALLERGVSKRGPSPTLNRINSRQAPNEAGYIPGSGMTSMISIHAPGICR